MPDFSPYIDNKAVSKALAVRLKEVLPSLITHEQAAYVQNVCNRKLKKLILFILKITDTLNIKGYLVTIDIEDANNSLRFFSLMAAPKKFGLGSNF